MAIDRVPDEILGALKKRLEPDTNKGVATTFLLHTCTMRLILEELEARRKTEAQDRKAMEEFIGRVALGQEIDQSDLNRVRKALHMNEVHHA